jgi:ABC-type oligopeptide transport system ATPase subunit
MMAGPLCQIQTKSSDDGIVAQDKFRLMKVSFKNDIILTKGRLNSNQNFTQYIQITHIIHMVKLICFELG